MDGNAEYVLTQSMIRARGHACLAHLLHSANSLANGGNSSQIMVTDRIDRVDTDQTLSIIPSKSLNPFDLAIEIAEKMK